MPAAPDSGVIPYGKDAFMTRKIFFVLAMCALLLALLAGCETGPSELDRDLVILYTSDIRGEADGRVGFAGLAAYKSEM